MKNFGTLQEVDTSELSADDGVSVGGCCLPVQYAGEEADDHDPWTLREYLFAAGLGAFTLAFDLFILHLLGAF